MKVSDLVPSTSGLALKVGAETIVNPGSIFNPSSLVSGSINKSLANRLCHANSFTTRIFKRVSSSAPAYPLNTNNSFLSSR